MRHVRPTNVSISELLVTQQEMLGEDIDIDELIVKMNYSLKHSVDISNMLIGGSVNRTIEGASTLTISLQDHDRILLNSGKLSGKLDVSIQGLWWRFTSLNKSGDVLDLVFEEREIAVLRSYNSIIPLTSRLNMTRAQFILQMIKEVKEFNIEWYIPDVYKIQPIVVMETDLNKAIELPDMKKGIKYITKLLIL